VERVIIRPREDSDRIAEQSRLFALLPGDLRISDGKLSDSLEDLSGRFQRNLAPAVVSRLSRRTHLIKRSWPSPLKLAASPSPLKIRIDEALQNTLDPSMPNLLAFELALDDVRAEAIATDPDQDWCLQL
jgi:hypothetical protein